MKPWLLTDGHTLAVHIGLASLCLDSVNVAAWVQAASAMAIVVLTGLLAWTTRRYAQATDQAVKLSREQFEREWRPSIHVRVVKEDLHSPELEVTNLGRMAVVVVKFYVRFTDTPKLTEEVAIPRPFPLASGHRDTVTIASRVERIMKKLNIAQPEFPPPGGIVKEMRTNVAIMFDYIALGARHQTQWFNFVLITTMGNVVDLRSAE
jgi:hypothetical protein